MTGLTPMTPPVTQAAIEAAGKMIRDYWGDTDPQMIALAQLIEAGCADHATFVQAFAKAIAEETERCARIADAWVRGAEEGCEKHPYQSAEWRIWEAQRIAAFQLATAIRAKVAANTSTLEREGGGRDG